jgi:hypothetical protein
MPATFFDGSRMRTRAPGEGNSLGGADIAARFALGFFILIGIIAWNLLREALWPRARTADGHYFWGHGPVRR